MHIMLMMLCTKEKVSMLIFSRTKKSITYKNLRKTLNTKYKFFAASINNNSKDDAINPFKSRRPEVDNTLALSPSSKVDGQTRTTSLKNHASPPALFDKNVTRKMTQANITHSCPRLQIIDSSFVNGLTIPVPKRKKKVRPKSAGN